jgi:hypothetical protein
VIRRGDTATIDPDGTGRYGAAMIEALPALTRVVVASAVLGGATICAACSGGSGGVGLDGGTSGATRGGTSGTATTSGGTSGTTSGGTSGTTGAVARAIVAVTLRKGAQATCAGAGQTLAIGTFMPVAPVTHGSADASGGMVEISCKVAPSATSGFDLNLSFDVTKPSGGSNPDRAVAMSGNVSETGTTGTTGFVSVVANGLQYSSVTCTFDPTTATGGAGGIAAGRY